MRPNRFHALFAIVGAMAVASAFGGADIPAESTRVDDSVLIATVGEDLGTRAASGGDVCAEFNPVTNTVPALECNFDDNDGEDCISCSGSPSTLSGSSLGAGDYVTPMGPPGGPPSSTPCIGMMMQVGECVDGSCTGRVNNAMLCNFGRYPNYAGESIIIGAATARVPRR